MDILLKDPDDLGIDSGYACGHYCPGGNLEKKSKTKLLQRKLLNKHCSFALKQLAGAAFRGRSMSHYEP